jgi:hypothetical protein
LDAYAIHAKRLTPTLRRAATNLRMNRDAHRRRLEQPVGQEDPMSEQSETLDKPDPRSESYLKGETARAFSEWAGHKPEDGEPMAWCAWLEQARRLEKLADRAWKLCEAVQSSYQEDAFGAMDERLDLEQALTDAGFAKPNYYSASLLTPNPASPGKNLKSET